MSYYFLINIAAISIPFIAGFDRRLSFHRQWKFIFPAMLITMLVFIPWDIFKTAKGVWGFNPDYVQGIYLYNLPVEEVLFFIAIPYACLFTYHALNSLVKKDYIGSGAKAITVILALTLLISGLINIHRTYTSVTFITTSLFLLTHMLTIKDNYLGRFYFTYAIILIPFFIVNGALTGLFTPEPVVWYDNNENLGIRIGTIPIEDSVYGLLLLLMNTTIYEALRKRKQKAGFATIMAKKNEADNN